MINSHYIPQLILRHFCEDNKLQYCDIDKKKVEVRTTKTVFSERGYYPEELEKGLCEKIESQFAKLLNNKILKERHRVILTGEEMFILKKYLIITVLRYKTDEVEKDPMLAGLRKEEIRQLKGDFFDNINKILECETKEDAFKYVDFENRLTNMMLFAYVKDILCSYTVFAKSNNCKEDFILPDRGWVGYQGPIHIKKFNATLDLAMKTGDPFLFQIARHITPHDYSVFPLSRNLAVISMSAFFKLCMKGSLYNIVFPPEAPTLSAALGFGNSQVIAAPKVHSQYGKENEYICKIQQLCCQDMKFLNSLLFSNIERYFAYADGNRVKRSFDFITELEKI